MKNKIIALIIFISSLLLSITYTGFVGPDASNLLSALFLIVLLYISFASVIYLFFALFNRTKGALGVSMLIGLLLPIIILLISLRQFGIFELFLVVVTIVLITWYKVIKNNKQ